LAALADPRLAKAIWHVSGGALDVAPTHRPGVFFNGVFQLHGRIGGAATSPKADGAKGQQGAHGQESAEEGPRPKHPLML
jgi:hypothetical protein